MSGLVVVEDATIKCSNGTTQSSFKVARFGSLLLHNKKIGHITENLPNVNIPPFGICLITRSPCTPITPSPWTSDITHIIDANIPITANSQLVCGIGGVVSIQFPGQTSFSINSGIFIPGLEILDTPIQLSIQTLLKDVRDSSLKEELLKQNSLTPELTIWLEKEMKKNANSPIAWQLRSQNINGNNTIGIEILDMSDTSSKIALENKVAAYSTWIEMVDYGKPWDHKLELETAKINTVKLEGDDFKYDVIANIHYGYIGAAAGFSDIELKAGAGAAQIWREKSIVRLASDLGSFGDDSKDQAAIAAGIWLQKNPDKTLKDAINEFGDKLARPD